MQNSTKPGKKIVMNNSYGKKEDSIAKLGLNTEANMCVHSSHEQKC